LGVGGSLNWLIIALVLLIGFGPVLWLVPSRRDRRLARMRNRARALGILVEMVEIDDPDPAPEARVSAGGKLKSPKIAGAAYRLPLLRPRTLAPSWSIARSRREPGPDNLPGWQWTSEPEGDVGYWEDVRRVVARVPDDVFACEADPNAVSFVWRERVGDDDPETSVERLVDLLREFSDIQRLSHVARETELDRQRFEEEEVRKGPG